MIRPFSLTALCCGVALVATAVAAPAFAAAPASHNDVPVTTSPFRMDASVTAPLANLRYQPEGMSTSNDVADAGDPTSGLNLETGDGSGQPPPRRTYARSRYQDRMHNADGSYKIAFVAGGGAAVPAANTAKYYTPSYNILVGAGINFSRHFGILGEFSYANMGVSGLSLNTEYNNLIGLGATPAQLAGFDGNAHVIGISVNPVYSFVNEGSRLGAYFTGGVGYYRKSTNFTLPTVATSCNTFYCQQYVANYNIDSASANAFGANGGVGFTYKFSEFSTQRLFMEARYTWLNISANSNDFFPYNARNSEYVPVTVGIRF